MESICVSALSSLSGSVNGLVILSSASIAISQYMMSSIKSRYDEPSRDLDNMQPMLLEVLDYWTKNDPKLQEVIANEYDNLTREPAPSIGKPLSALVGVWCGISVLMSICNIISAADLCILTPYARVLIACLSVALTGVAIWTAYRMKRERERVRDYRIKVNALAARIIDFKAVIAASLKSSSIQH